MTDQVTPFCEACGTVDETALAMLQARDEQIRSLQETLDNAHAELDSKLAQIKRLKRDQDKALRDSPQYEDAIEVLEHWKDKCWPDARELGGQRLANTEARLKGGYTKADLIRCVDGYALKPYVVNGRRTHDGPMDAWQADAELIFRGPKQVDQGIRFAQRADELRQVMAKTELPSDASSTVSRFALSELGTGALRLAEAGCYVFPCQARGKAPATPHGLLDAKREPDAIRRYWQRHPDANVAIRTGSDTGIVVMDLDGDIGWENYQRFEDAHQEIPDTKSVKTPGGGQHFYFLHPGTEIRNTTDFPAEGMDFRGDGGYVLAPPSISAEGRKYEVDDECPIIPMPDWLVNLYTGYQAKLDRELSGATDWVKFIGKGVAQGQRNDRMTRYVGHLIGHGMTAREAYATAKVINVQLKPPLTEKDLQTIVRSIARRHTRAAA